MTIGQELWEALRRDHSDAACFGGVCYLRLFGGNLAKVELTSTGGYYNGIRVTILNPRSGPVDAVEIHNWDLPRKAEKAESHSENEAWDIYRPALDVEALTEQAEEYLRLFCESASETR